MRMGRWHWVCVGCLAMLLLAGCPPLPEENGPTAAFSGTPLMGNAPLRVQFTDQSTNTAGAAVTFHWDFGDGTESAEASPRHTYQEEGTYSVTLTVTTGDGSDSEEKIGYVTVLPRPGDDAPITFGDENLEAAVRQALGIMGGAVTVGDARRAVSLQIVDVMIADLEGLQYFTGLDVLRVSGGYDGQTALDLTPLASLNNLRELYLNGAGITDLTPLEELTGLEVLHVYGNFIDDVSPLADLTALRTLYLYNNEIADLSPLSQLTNLVDLNLFGNLIQDASPLAGLINLHTLYLDNNQVSTLGFVVNLVSLESLYLGMNAIMDVSPLADLDTLVALGLNDNMITAIDPLAGLTNLTALFIEGNPLTPESACPTIQTLQSGGTEVEADFACDGA